MKLRVPSEVSNKKKKLKLHSPLDKCATCFGLNIEGIWASTIIAQMYQNSQIQVQVQCLTRRGEMRRHSWRQWSCTSKNCLFVRLRCIKSTFPNYCFHEHIGENLYTVLYHHQNRYPTRSRPTEWNRTNVLSQDCFCFDGAE
jgi:hypothetical protein